MQQYSQGSEKARKKELKKIFLQRQKLLELQNLSPQDRFARSVGFSSYGNYLDDCNRRGLCLSANRPQWLDDTALDDLD